ncbi:MAG: beta-propeller fold lactonase family protein, partial [Chthoniobacteraceae bacterium]
MKSARISTRFPLLFAALLLESGGLFAKEKLEASPGEEAQRRPLEEVQRFSSEELRAVTSVRVSDDGKFLYAAAYQSSAVAVFKRNATTGQIEADASIETPELAAAVSVRLSPDNKLAAVAAFRANAINLFKRDAETGELIFLDVAVEGEKGASGLNFAIDSAFSADNRFLYTGAATGLGIFEIADEKLGFVASETAGGKLMGVRGVVISPSGSLLYAAATQSGTLGVFKRDAKTGKIELL